MVAPRVQRRLTCGPSALAATAASVAVAVAAAAAGAEDKDVVNAASPSPAAVKARVEAGEGVPFFDERLSCRDDGGVWSDFKELVQYARLRVFDQGEGPKLAKLLAEHLAARTANVTEILQCNVGVIAAYHLLARHQVAIGEDWRAYRLLQLALIYVFTLRNALEVPPDAAHDWATRTDYIVREIKILKKRLGQEQHRRAARLPDVAPDYRDAGLRVALVSICAYPENHPLVLRNMTPRNRMLYTERHGYGYHVHMEHPMPGTGVHIQHAKLQLVADYLRSGDYDWVAWLDCDSILMNMNRTMDSVIHRYARDSARPREPSSEGRDPSGADASSISSARADDRGGVDGESIASSLEVGCAGDELDELDDPLPDEELEAIVSHMGSCNSWEGCNASVCLRVNRHTTYDVTVSAALVDMEDNSERLASVSAGGRQFGECNPAPESDYDCGLFDCYQGVELPHESVATGSVLLKVHAVRTNNDCRCSRLDGTCYSAALAAFEEASEGEKTTDPSYGMFVKFKLTPRPQDSGNKTSAAVAEHRLRDIQRQTATPSVAGQELISGSVRASVVRRGAECEGSDLLLGISISLEECLAVCKDIMGCEFAAYGTGRKSGHCYWEMSDCTSFEEDSYTVYRIIPDVVNSTWLGSCGTQDCNDLSGCFAGCGPASSVTKPLQERPSAVSNGEDFLPVDLLITEEGWGLSSANWLIRSSEWSIQFLEDAFRVCHEEMPLFGDQDCMIHLLLNRRSVGEGIRGDPLDPHAVIVPQRELNAYDALNAHYMGCDGYEDGDLLVTFPGCKDPQACNPLFKLAFAHAEGQQDDDEPVASNEVARVRLFGPAEEAATLYETFRRSSKRAS